MQSNHNNSTFPSCQMKISFSSQYIIRRGINMSHARAAIIYVHILVQGIRMRSIVCKHGYFDLRGKQIDKVNVRDFQAPSSFSETALRTKFSRYRIIKNIYFLYKSTLALVVHCATWPWDEHPEETQLCNENYWCRSSLVVPSVQ